MKLKDVCVKLENEAQLDRLIKAVGKLKTYKNPFRENDCFRLGIGRWGNWFLDNDLKEVTESEFLKMLSSKRGAKPKGNVQYQRRIKPEFVNKLDNYLNILKDEK
jgi:hypothetical protein